MSVRDPIQQNYTDRQAELLASDGVDDSLEQARKTGWPEADEMVCESIFLRHCVKGAQVDPESQGSLQDSSQFLSMPFNDLGGVRSDWQGGACRRTQFVWSMAFQGRPPGAPGNRPNLAWRRSQAGGENRLALQTDATS